MYLPPVLWAWIRAPATHFLGARILTSLTTSTPPAAFSALPQHLPFPFSVIVLSSQYLFQRGPIWFTKIKHSSQNIDSQWHPLLHITIIIVHSIPYEIRELESEEMLNQGLSHDFHNRVSKMGFQDNRVSKPPH